MNKYIVNIKWFWSAVIIFFLFFILLQKDYINNIEEERKIFQSNTLDKAEIQVIDLLHLVETNNKKVFSEIIAYYENNKTQALKDYIEIHPKLGSRINDRYFNYLKKLMEDCYNLKPPTGNIDTDYSFVVTDSKKIHKNNRTMIRVSLKYCLPDEVQCEDKICYFDFIPVGDQVYLLDINDAGLYK